MTYIDQPKLNKLTSQLNTWLAEKELTNQEALTLLRSMIDEILARGTVAALEEENDN